MSINPANVPESLRPLIPLVEKWGATQSDSQRYHLADVANSDPKAMQELESLAGMWSLQIAEAWDEWVERAPLGKSPERAKFYFAFLLLDELRIKFPSFYADRISAYKADLSRPNVRHGSSVLIAARMLAIAARSRPELTQVLRSAAQSDVPHIRACALAALCSNPQEVPACESQIQTILNSVLEDRKTSIVVAAALAEIRKPIQRRLQEALTTAAIIDDPERIGELLSLVDVNARDHNGQTALKLARGNGHTQCVEALQRAGAIE